MSRRGLLLTMTEPPPAMDEEFNAWYDEEHLPERLSIPGFRSARRWVADVPPGEGRYLATYELDSVEVLSSPAYLAFFDKPTPWSRRCLGRTVVFRRWACEQVEPGSADPQPGARGLWLLLGAGTDFPGKGGLSRRRFRAHSGEPADIVLVELADAGIDVPLGRVYRAYG